MNIEKSDDNQTKTKTKTKKRSSLRAVLADIQITQWEVHFGLDFLPADPTPFDAIDVQQQHVRELGDHCPLGRALQSLALLTVVDVALEGLGFRKIRQTV